MNLHWKLVMSNERSITQIDRRTTFVTFILPLFGCLLQLPTRRDVVFGAHVGNGTRKSNVSWRFGNYVNDMNTQLLAVAGTNKVILVYTEL